MYSVDKALLKRSVNIIKFNLVSKDVNNCDCMIPFGIQACDLVLSCTEHSRSFYFILEVTSTFSSCRFSEIQQFSVFHVSLTITM